VTLVGALVVPAATVTLAGTVAIPGAALNPAHHHVVEGAGRRSRAKSGIEGSGRRAEGVEARLARHDEGERTQGSSGSPIPRPPFRLRDSR
jgi:hypothetical protein